MLHFKLKIIDVVHVKKEDQTTVEFKKCVIYTTEIISMVMPVIIDALGRVTKRLVDSQL